jgi:hypothetical protein
MPPGALPGGKRRRPDQPRVLDRRLPVLHRFAINRIADHLDKSGDRRIFRDEAMIPALMGRADQHQFKPALPDDASAQAGEHGPAFAAIGGIGVRAARLPSVAVAGLRAQPHEIEHVDRPGAVIGAECGEGFFGRIDMAGHKALRGWCTTINHFQRRRLP